MFYCELFEQMGVKKEEPSDFIVFKFDFENFKSHIIILVILILVFSLFIVLKKRNQK